VSLGAARAPAAARAPLWRPRLRRARRVPGYYQGVETAVRLQRDVRVRRAAPGERQASPGS
jgi:hypothetical protein